MTATAPAAPPELSAPDAAEIADVDGEAYLRSLEAPAFPIRPLNDIVIIRRDKPAEKTASGLLYVPDTAKRRVCEGTVLAVGPGYEMPDGLRVPVDCKTGDRVCWAPFNGNDKKVVVDGKLEELLFIVASQVLGELHE